MKERKADLLSSGDISVLNCQAPMGLEDTASNRTQEYISTYLKPWINWASYRPDQIFKFGEN